MAAILQIKSAEANRLRLELESISYSLSESLTLLNSSILNSRNRELNDIVRVEIKEEAENLLTAYQNKSDMASSPALSVRLCTAIRKYSGAVLASAVADAVKTRSIQVPQHLSGNSSYSLDNFGVSSIDKRRLEHIRTYAACKRMLSHVGKLVQKRDELRRKTNSSSILSTATLDGLKAKRDYLENHLAALKAREGTINSLKQEVRKASRFSTDFEKSFMDKKSQLVRARTCLNSLLSNASSLKSSALGRFESALNSINRLSALLDKLRANSDGEGINLGASAAIDISRLARLPRLGTCGVPYLYKEICKRLHSAPFLIPIEKVLERLHQIIVDGDCINLVNDELDASLRSMKELHDALIPSLEKAQTEEKEVCMMMATALHKIAFHCAKVSEKQKRLEELWKYWSD